MNGENDIHQINAINTINDVNRFIPIPSDTPRNPNMRIVFVAKFFKSRRYLTPHTIYCSVDPIQLSWALNRMNVKIEMVYVHKDNELYKTAISNDKYPANIKLAEKYKHLIQKETK